MLTGFGVVYWNHWKGVPTCLGGVVSSRYGDSIPGDVSWQSTSCSGAGLLIYLWPPIGLHARQINNWCHSLCHSWLAWALGQRSWCKGCLFCKVLNCIIEFEQIPAALKQAIIIPVYKGGGKDPLSVNSYRCITLNSAISKVLKSLTVTAVTSVT